MKTLFCRIKNNDGSIINIALTMLLLMSAMGISATITTTDDVKIATNYKYDRVAFFDAFSGIQYGLTQMENDLKAKTLTFPSTIYPSTGSTMDLAYTVPTNFSFGLSPISRDATNLYSFIATGAGPKNATAAIEVVFEREKAIAFGAFGDALVDMKASAAVYSYDSRDIPNPTPSDTGNECDVGSNKEVSVKNGTIVNGDVVLGEQTDGTDGYITDPSGGAVYDGPVNTGRVEPDPLGVGVVGGDYASKFTTYSTSNDNNLAVPPIGAAKKIDLGNGDTMTLHGKSGGANYYLSSIDLANHATLTVNADASHPVNIFLTGKLDAKNGAIINNNGLPTDFTVFSNSNQLIGIHHGGVFKGLIYAPYATVELKNSADLYGAIWAKTVDLKNSGEVYFDTALKDKYLLSDLNVLSWRQLW